MKRPIQASIWSSKLRSQWPSIQETSIIPPCAPAPARDPIRHHFLVFPSTFGTSYLYMERKRACDPFPFTPPLTYLWFITLDIAHEYLYTIHTCTHTHVHSHETFLDMGGAPRKSPFSGLSFAFTYTFDFENYEYLWRLNTLTTTTTITTTITIHTASRETSIPLPFLVLCTETSIV